MVSGTCMRCSAVHALACRTQLCSDQMTRALDGKSPPATQLHRNRASAYCSARLVIAALIVAMIVETPVSLASENNDPSTNNPEEEFDVGVLTRKRPAHLSNPIFDEILVNPPKNFFQMRNLIPYHLYGKTQNGEHVAYFTCKDIDYDKVKTISRDDIYHYVRFLSTLFWGYVEQDPKARLVLVLDMEGLSLTQAISGHGRAVIDGVIGGLSDMNKTLGPKTNDILVLNVSMFMSPIIAIVGTFADPSTNITSYNKPNQWAPVLQERIHPTELPKVYGGQGKYPLNKSPTDAKIDKLVTAIFKSNLPNSKL